MIPYFIISILSGFQIGWGIGRLIVTEGNIY